MFYEGIVPKVCKKLWKHKNEDDPNVLSKQSVKQISQRLRVYPFQGNEQHLESLLTDGWSSSQFRDFLKAAPVIFRNFFPKDAYCTCGVEHISQNVRQFFNLE